LVAHWATSSKLRIGGALLVAVVDPASLSFPSEAIGFAPVPRHRLPFQSILVASSNDPFGSVEYANRCASSWGSRFVTIGAAGHINTTGGFGEWEDGFSLLRTLISESNPIGKNSK
jgi:predicted alpha/beta hydrolase family esterase